MADIFKKQFLHLCIMMWYRYHLRKINHGDLLVVINLKESKLKNKYNFTNELKEQAHKAFEAQMLTEILKQSYRKTVPSESKGKHNDKIMKHNAIRKLQWCNIRLPEMLTMMLNSLKSQWIKPCSARRTTSPMIVSKTTSGFCNCFTCTLHWTEVNSIAPWSSMIIYLFLIFCFLHKSAPKEMHKEGIMAANIIP